jgi:hypothetical protein
MSAGRSNFTPRDLERAINVARKAGLPVTGYTVSKTGDITVMTNASGVAPEGNERSPNPWDNHAADQKRPS